MKFSMYPAVTSRYFLNFLFRNINLLADKKLVMELYKKPIGEDEQTVKNNIQRDPTSLQVWLIYILYYTTFKK